MRPLIVGNWKMHGLSPQLDEIEAIAVSVQNVPAVADIIICLPPTLVERAAKIANGRIAIGGENCAADASGAFTGDVSAEMLRDAGASAVIVGHSERRRLHGETDSIVAAKAKAAHRAGLLAVICIGETKAQRASGNALKICGDQLTGSIPGGIDGSEIAVGYEPLWAIGSGHMPTSDEIGEMHAHIRQCLTELLGLGGKLVRILYGGSVKPDNAAAILAIPEVGGALVGGASLEAADFEAIFRAAPQMHRTT
jgi:triosephosphate isomerase